MKLLTKEIIEKTPRLYAQDGKGLVDGHEKEMGYFSIDELAGFRGPLGLGIERDINFIPKKLSEIKSGVA